MWPEIILLKVISNIFIYRLPQGMMFETKVLYIMLGVSYINHTHCTWSSLWAIVDACNMLIYCVCYVNKKVLPLPQSGERAKIHLLWSHNLKKYLVWLAISSHDDPLCIDYVMIFHAMWEVSSDDRLKLKGF